MVSSTMIKGAYNLDESLVGLCIESFLRLFVKSRTQILTFMLTLVPNCADAEDIMQNTAAIMWRKFHEFKLGTNFVS